MNNEDKKKLERLEKEVRELINKYFLKNGLGLIGKYSTNSLYKDILAFIENKEQVSKEEYEGSFSVMNNERNKLLFEKDIIDKKIVTALQTQFSEARKEIEGLREQTENLRGWKDQKIKEQDKEIENEKSRTKGMEMRGDVWKEQLDKAIQENKNLIIIRADEVTALQSQLSEKDREIKLVKENRNKSLIFNDKIMKDFESQLSEARAELKALNEFIEKMGKMTNPKQTN